MPRLSARPGLDRGSRTVRHPLRPVFLTASVGALVFLLAIDGGSFGLASRHTVAIVAWWTLAVAVALGVLPRRRMTPLAVVTVGLLVALALVTLASTTWGDSAERAFLEFDRVLLYLGVLLLTILATRAGTGGSIADGLAAGIAATALLALATRCLPGVFGEEEALTFLPALRNRLSYPLDYWNGLSIFTALGFPLLLRGALLAGRPLLRGLALAPLPALAGVIYLTSSRGGVATALAGILAFVALTDRRVAAVAAGAIAAVSAVAVVFVLKERPDLVNQPGTEAATSQGRTAALLIVAVCLACGAAHALTGRFARLDRERSPAVERAVLIAGAVLLAVGIAAADPVQRLRDFKEVPPEQVYEPGSTEEHLRSTTGTGRWQQWEGAIDSFRSEPLLGRGAGSYENWWAQHGTLSGKVRDAHSLYLETLGELGVVGFVPLAALFLLGLAAGFWRVLRAHGPARTTAAALTAAFAGYAVGAGIDWMWETTVATVVAMVVLGLLTGAALEREGAVDPPHARARRRKPLVAVTLVVAALAVFLEAVPLVADLKLRTSQEAFAEGDMASARAEALAARSLEPWASSPLLQLALIDEERGDLRSAGVWAREAVERDRFNWGLWLVRARLEAKLGSVDAGLRSLRRARELNPRSPLWDDDSQPG